MHFPIIANPCSSASVMKAYDVGDIYILTDVKVKRFGKFTCQLFVNILLLWNLKIINSSFLFGKCFFFKKLVACRVICMCYVYWVG